MASFYELTEDEIKILLETMDLFATDGKFWTDKEVKDFEELRHYLKTRKRPPVTFTSNIYRNNVRSL